MKLLMAGLFCLLALPAVADGITVNDRRGAQHFDAAPQRIAVLTWALAEQVLDLGVVPVAVPETGLYRTWVVSPPLPESVVDIGLRDSPNLERLSSLGPDVILASDIPAKDVARLEKIAPVLVFDTFSAEHDNIAASRDIFMTLARLLGRERMAARKLAGMEDNIDAMAAQLKDALGGTIRSAAVIRLNDGATMWAYGENSFPQEALRRLGLSNALAVTASRWGVAQRPVADLAKVETGAVLAIRPHLAGDAVFETALWPFLPAVRNGRFAETRPVWSYGGILSLERHARAFHDALTELEP